jgi:NIMA (never in mitosis gene a)-related kinase
LTKEASILKSLNHENIVQIYDSFTYDDSRKFAMILEYCDGGDLNKIIKTNRGNSKLIPESKIIFIFQKILDGLEYIHSKKIIHRDMKSLNIFLMKNGNVKIGDLGIAKVLLYSNCTNTVIGTPLYLAPEISKEKPYNEKSDIWSIGCILYELLTYSMPFDAPNYVGLCKKIQKGIYTPLNDNIKKFYSKELISVLDLILQVDPEKRPSVKDIKKYPIFKKEENILETPFDKNIKSKYDIIDVFKPNNEQINLIQNPILLDRAKKRCESAIVVINKHNDNIKLIDNEKLKENFDEINHIKKKHNISKDDENIKFQQKNNLKKFSDISNNIFDKDNKDNKENKINQDKINKFHINKKNKQENIYNLIKDNDSKNKNNINNINDIEKIKKKECLNRYNNILCNLKNVYKESIAGNKGFMLKNENKIKKREIKSSCDVQRFDNLIKNPIQRPFTPLINKKKEINSKRVRINPKAKNDMIDIVK